MKRSIVFGLMLLFVYYIIFADDAFVVRDLRVEDNPHDDGSGLIVKFRPLPAEARIIEYRIYRGVSPDTLFLLGRIEVNPRGHVGDEVLFFDASQI